MRQFAWYCPETNVIILQSIMEDCHICFEWGPQDLTDEYIENGESCGAYLYFWMPLGEL